MNSENARISVIVPIYNVEQYLEECIDSIIDQTYQNLQIILVNDGSTDCSGVICDRYKEKDKRIEVIHKANGGLSDARNVGLEHVVGEYVCFVDSDDKIDRTFVEYLYSELIRNKTQISACGFVAAFKNKTIQQPEKAGVFTSREAICKLIENVDFHDHVCTKLFSTELWKNIRFPMDRVYEDMRTTYKVILESKTICISDKCLYWYRQRGNGIARGRFTQKKWEMIDAVEEMAKDNRLLSDPNIMRLINERHLRVEGLVLRSLLLSAENQDYLNNKTQIDACLRNIKKNKWSILKNKTYPSSIKLIALLSNRSINFLRYIFGSPVLQRYYADKYTYYN